ARPVGLRLPGTCCHLGGSGDGGIRIGERQGCPTESVGGGPAAKNPAAGTCRTPGRRVIQRDGTGVQSTGESVCPGGVMTQDKSSETLSEDRRKEIFLAVVDAQ